MCCVYIIFFADSRCLVCVCCSLRVLPSLCCRDENSDAVLESSTGAIRAVIAGMRAHPLDHEVNLLSLNVIRSVLSRAHTVPTAGEACESARTRVLKEGGCMEIIKAIEHFPHNTALLLAALDVLNQTAGESSVAAIMAKELRLMPTLEDLLQQSNEQNINVTQASLH